MKIYRIAQAKPKTIPKEEIQIIRELYEGGTYVSDIAKIIQHDQHFISRVLIQEIGQDRFDAINRARKVRMNEAVFDQNKARKDYYRIRNELYDKVLQEVHNGTLIEDISNKFNLDIHVVKKFVEENENNRF